MNVSIIANQMMVLFLMMVAGYGAYKRGMVSREGTKSLSSLIVNILNPCLILSGVMNKEVTYGPRLILENLLLVFLMFALLIVCLLYTSYVYCADTLKEEMRDALEPEQKVPESTAAVEVVEPVQPGAAGGAGGGTGENAGVEKDPTAGEVMDQTEAPGTDGEQEVTGGTEDQMEDKTVSDETAGDSGSSEEIGETDKAESGNDNTGSGSQSGTDMGDGSGNSENGSGAGEHESPHT